MVNVLNLLHVLLFIIKTHTYTAPCGDWWTGNEIFAAKHLQPDYVRSVKIPSGFDPEQLTDKQRMEIYDSGSLPNKSNGVRE